MELYDIVKIYWNERRLFTLIVVASFFIALVWQVSQPITYQAALLLNVGREGTQTTTEYTFDNFYRLQADERFGDTVVRWLQSPRVVSDILKESGLDASFRSERDLKRLISAKRLSSQVIELSFSQSEKSVLEKEANAIVKVLNTYTERLNQDGQKEGWFVIVGSDPVLLDARVSLPKAVGVGGLLGCFVAFWTITLVWSFRQSIVKQKMKESKP
ncbi:MAG: hypothetical protein KBC83_00785 [Candidatus Moranbacteria bacterium]|jgi:uncharacterized protein involved in exopolysaccharide biosynthesis|nr:hypothetical protein [Candidatus Moranbacteria bacterium]MBP9801193.1 hypothetical protein [Candidatus Moranbacteria bacterium]